MEMCYLWGNCRPRHSGEPAINKSGPVAKRKKQEKVRARNLISHDLIKKEVVRP